MINRRIETVDLIELMVSQMSFVFKADDIIDNGNGSYTLLTCNTFHLQPTFKLNIGGIEYTITQVIDKTSITITGPSLPSESEFEIYPFYFFNGRISDVDEELRPVKRARNKTPMLYLRLDFEEEFLNGEEPEDRISPLTLIFLTQSNIKWTISEIREMAIKPMRNLAYDFLTFIEAQTYIGEIDSYRMIDRMKYGIVESDTSKPTKTFNEFLSGVEMSLDLKILMSVEECCGSLVSKKKVVIIDQNGNVVEELIPGQIYQITILEGIQDTIDENETTIVDDII
jgi:hypothetical protein